MSQQNIIDKISKKLLRFGFADMVSDGTFDPDSEEMVEFYFLFVPGPEFQVWYWNGQTFQTMAP